jgi:hypothetical protein
MAKLVHTIINVSVILCIPPMVVEVQKVVLHTVVAVAMVPPRKTALVLVAAVVAVLLVVVYYMHIRLQLVTDPTD